MEMYRLMKARNPAIKESQVRGKLGQFHFSKDLADNAIGSLSGGEKARLLFAIMSFDEPHLLLLDEPTLQGMADLTGGAYYRAEDAEQLGEVFTNLPFELIFQDGLLDLSFIT